VDVRFSATGPLPGADGRPVGGKLTSIAIGPAAPVSLAEIGSPRPPTRGIDADGWAAAASDIDLPIEPSAPGIVLEIEYPGWAGVPAGGAVRISIDGAASAAHVLKPGRNSVILPVTPGRSVRRLHLEGAQTFRLPAPDGRERSFRILSAEGIQNPLPMDGPPARSR